MKTLLLPIFCGLLAAPLFADTIYKTRDERGVVRYSDQPPSSVIHVEILTIPRTTVQGGDQSAREDAARQRLQQTIETAERLREDRLAREAVRAGPSYEEPAREPLPQLVIIEREQRGHGWLVPYSPLHPKHRPPYKPPYRPSKPPVSEPEPPRRGVDERRFHIPLRRLEP